jgi:hypothetical protein
VGLQTTSKYHLPARRARVAAKPLPIPVGVFMDQQRQS